MVARLISVSEDTELSDLNDVFQHVMGWSGDLGYSFRIHGQEFNSFRRRTRAKSLREFRLHRQEKFLYICDLLDVWEWEVRVMDIQEGATEDPDPLCLGGRGAAPPESCGGPRGYRLMLKRQQQGATDSDPALVEATIQLLSATHPEQPAKPEAGYSTSSHTTGRFDNAAWINCHQDSSSGSCPKASIASRSFFRSSGGTPLHLQLVQCSSVGFRIAHVFICNQLGEAFVAGVWECRHA